ncbi:NAD(P)H-dependent oxidoreductase [Kaistia adipata]|uniref:NAD(P)H-dependent oxidoreductase n=1 Tax=Kaistia adipata TaxID=166954 RepID=UPI0003FA9731|nr:NAD(P)H-dependent oxidoreductase [Kaistia adipata]
MSVTRIGEFRAAEGEGSTLADFLVAVRSAILGSEGAISCEVLRDRAERDRFLVIERWQSIEAHQASVRNIPPEMLKTAMALFAEAPKGGYFDDADAFVFVLPEYNHGFPASIKNAMDYLSHEWADKPLGFVSYGGVSGSTRAVQLLKPVAAALGLVVAGEVNIPFFAQYRQDAAFTPPESFTDSANLMLNRIAKVGATLKAGRKELVAA